MTDGFDALGAEVTQDFVADLADDDFLALVKQQGGVLGKVVLDRALQLERRIDEALSVWSKVPDGRRGELSGEMARILSASERFSGAKEGE